jgi:hypothetical protein
MNVPRGKVMEQSTQLSEVFVRWWRKITGDECPERRERLLGEHIDDINQGIAVFEARRLRELEQKSAFGRRLNTPGTNATFL